MHRILRLFLLLVAFASFCLMSYGVDKSKLKTVTVGKRTCYLYEVAEGETLYGISRAFEVSQEEIIELNDVAQKGVKKGMKLRIPAESSRRTNEVGKKEATASVTGNKTHKVQAGETVYGIVHQYGITADELKAANPTFDGNLKAGQTIVIPESKKVKTKDVNLQTHTVQPKETLYGISRQYGVTREQMVEANPELKERMPRIGEKLLIPKQGVKNNEKASAPTDRETEEVLDTIKPTEYVVTRYQRPEATDGAAAVKVSLLLPFMLDRESEQDQTLNKFVEFYEGILIGLGELKEAGYNVRLDVYDIEKMPDKVESVLRKNPAIGQSDLIIGPAYAGQVGVLSRYSERHQVPLLVPFTRRASGIMQNRFTFQFNGSVGSEWAFATDLAAKYLLGKNVIVVNYNNDANDEGSQYAKYLSQKLPQFGITNQQVNYSNYSFPSLYTSLSETQENVVVLGTREGGLVREALAEISRWRERGRKVTVLGFDAWGTTVLEQAKPVCYHSKFYEDTKEAAYQDYVGRMRRAFGLTNTRNPRYDLIGRDMIVYFVRHLSRSGKMWTPAVDTIEEELQSRFSWRRMGNGGYVNQGCYFITKE
ncbi:MAG: LysM peptidoglycan-binding domain-containing protein [Paludibacteraceae bacterium]|nr:LysM peptidoglycan-binding domain-containing protein [Paludibacteraceae bacterium]